MAIITETQIPRKRIVRNKPKAGDVSQYTFKEGETNFDYENSTSLPEDIDRFQNKDLNITAVGDKVNEAIVDRNLKSEDTGFIRIDKCFVEFVGTPTPLKNVSVSLYVWSKQYGEFWNNAAGLSNSFTLNFSGINEVLDQGDVDERVFTYEVGDLASGEDLGNLSSLEGENLVSNIMGPGPNMEVGSFSGANSDFLIYASNQNPPSANDGNGGDAVGNAPFSKVDQSIDTDSRLMDKDVFNPIYLIFEITGDGPGNDRDARWQIFQIDNQDVFKTERLSLSYDEMFVEEMFDGAGDDVWPEDPPLKITDLQITIDVRDRDVPSFSDKNSYLSYIPLVEGAIPFPLIFSREGLPVSNFGENVVDRLQNGDILKISPKQELQNLRQDSGYATGFYDLRDFFPKQKIGILNTETNQLEPDIYLDEYRDDEDERIQSLTSTPCLVGFEFEMMENTQYGNLPSDDTTPIDTLENLARPNQYAREYFYFVINWDDSADEIKTLDDWLDVRPTTIEELAELQQDNLYLVYQHSQLPASGGVDIRRVNGIPTNIYTTPGIKTIKTIVIAGDSAEGTYGRWKLVTSRIFLGSSDNQKPEFDNLGGTDYTTFPWPFTTPIIGGVDDNSNYKKSVRESISCAKLSTTDVIDEKLLSDDLQNDEMGKSINQMDLEQVRYFNKSHDISSLLNISTIPFYDDFDYWDGGSISSSFSEESLVGQILINDNLDLDLKQSCKLELNTGNVTDNSIYDSSGNSNKGLLIGDYKIKKPRKGRPMRRDTFIKTPKKSSNKDGAM